MTITPRISVLMSVYNGERYLRAAVDSILAQTFGDFECIIVDDGSTDSTPAVLGGFKDQRLRVIRNDSNLGLTRSLNRGMEVARSPLIARMDSDDICHPCRLETQWNHMGRHPELGVLGTAYHNIGRDGRPFLKTSFSGEHGFLMWYLMFQNPIAHPTVLMRTELVREAGGYRAEMRFAQDLDLWLRLGTRTRLSNLSEPLLQLRHHAHSITSLHLHEQQSICARIRAELLPQLLGPDRASIFKSRVEAEESVLARRFRHITELHRAFTAAMSLNRDELALIRRDCAFRLGLMALRYAGEGETGRMLAAAHSLDPLVGLRLVAWPASRYLLRHVRNGVLRG